MAKHFMTNTVIKTTYLIVAWSALDIAGIKTISQLIYINRKESVYEFYTNTFN